MTYQLAADYFYRLCDPKLRHQLPNIDGIDFPDDLPITPLPSDHPRFNQLIRVLNQPRTPQLMEYWRPRLKGHPFCEQQARQFIRQLLGTFESVDFLLDYRCTGGSHIMNEGSLYDFKVYRPGKKQGWSLHLTTTGQGIYHSLHSHRTVHKGDLILLSPDALYDYHRILESSQWHFQWAIFQPDSQLLDLINWPRFGDGLYHLKAGDDAYTGIKQALTQISELGLSSQENTVALRTNLLQQVLLRARLTLPDSEATPLDHRIQLAIQYIEEHFVRGFSVTEIASCCGLSAANLTRLIKQYTGLSVLEIRDEKRMALAREKLTHSTLNIADIAELCGYSDQAYFTRCFRRYFARTPMEYRHNYLKELN